MFTRPDRPILTIIRRPRPAQGPSRGITTATCSRAVRRAKWLAIAVAATTLTGCRLCSTCEMEDYSAYGGIWERTQRDSGRVGSLFDPAGVRGASLASKSDPPSAAELERRRQQSFAEPESGGDGSSGDVDNGSQGDAPPSGGNSPDVDDTPKPDLEELKLEDIDVTMKPLEFPRLH
ncbi:hypothetical protein [Crateriforma conspicua]|uniref:Uncharacterized protein n=1 Tax=Crateriforma conspicua TaxID=2527996 RepID=A0A5C6FYC5_9PLAN|nr:hypothetical protein [Crateriforma conspicua]TWU66310.1 hypothetical protein V7x_18740 [Crateriforma conspicua]